MTPELTQDDIENLTIFAESEFCTKCPCTNCWNFYNGTYQNCNLVLREFLKARDEYNSFLNSVQQPVIPGKCYQCRQNETNDKDHDYTLITAKRPDGKIHLHAKLCSVHLKELEDAELYSITKHKVVN